MGWSNSMLDVQVCRHSVHWLETAEMNAFVKGHI